MGQCPSCGEWDTFVEEREEEKTAPGNRRIEVKPITALQGISAERIPTGMSELDRVLGGGIVRGSAVLIGGSPGAGKSTLLLQMAQNLASSGKKVLYATAEESASQVKMRAERLGVNSSNILLYAGSLWEEVEESAERENPDVIILDSVQTFRREGIPSSPGSPLQVREVTGRCVEYAKTKDTAVFLIGHVTKEGLIAGPRLLEHMVDTVIYFDAGGPEGLRLLRAVKNRFGAVNEVGAFIMTERGLREVPDPASLFLSGEEKEAGSALAGVREGTRDFVVEIHTLIRPVPYGYGRRVITGLEGGRVLQVLATVEKFSGRDLRQFDVYVSTVRGLKIKDTSADLGVAASVYSAMINRPLPDRAVFLGEVTLTGRVLPDLALEERISTLQRMGWEEIYAPFEGENVITIRSVEELLNKLKK